MKIIEWDKLMNSQLELFDEYNNGYFLTEELEMLVEDIEEFELSDSEALEVAVKLRGEANGD